MTNLVYAVLIENILHLGFLLCFPQIFIRKGNFMIQNNKNYKRQTREMPDAVKQKISASLRGRSKSYTHTQNISAGLKRYWEQIGTNDQNSQ